LEQGEASAVTGAQSAGIHGQQFDIGATQPALQHGPARSDGFDFQAVPQSQARMPIRIDLQVRFQVGLGGSGHDRLVAGAAAGECKLAAIIELPAGAAKHFLTLIHGRTRCAFDSTPFSMLGFSPTIAFLSISETDAIHL
jgi:hypothetical protein